MQPNTAVVHIIKFRHIFFESRYDDAELCCARRDLTRRDASIITQSVVYLQALLQPSVEFAETMIFYDWVEGHKLYKHASSSSLLESQCATFYCRHFLKIVLYKFSVIYVYVESFTKRIIYWCSVSKMTTKMSNCVLCQVLQEDKLNRCMMVLNIFGVK